MGQAGQKQKKYIFQVDFYKEQKYTTVFIEVPFATKRAADAWCKQKRGELETLQRSQNNGKLGKGVKFNFLTKPTRTSQKGPITYVPAPGFTPITRICQLDAYQP